MFPRQPLFVGFHFWGDSLSSVASANCERLSVLKKDAPTLGQGLRLRDGKPKPEKMSSPLWLLMILEPRS